MTPFDVNEIEAVAKLMAQYELDEYASERFTLKKSRHPAPARPGPTDQALLKLHIEPLPNEPWEAVSQEVADTWAVNGKG